MTSPQWCILRCSGPNTLPLLTSLTKAGFEVWTPVELITRRVPKANVKRRLENAMLPSYLFAAADRLIDLIQLANTPGKDHRDFRVFKQLDRFPLIADATLAPLRLEERRKKPAPEGLKAGDDVRMTDGAYAGLRGVVEKGGSKFAVVRVPGFQMSLKIAAYYLLRDESGSAIMRAA